MYPIRNCVIEDLLPERSLGIISGSSGAGKTILTMQSVEEWYTKSTFLGFSARPNPRITYYTYDRSQEDAWDTLRKLGMYFPQMAIHCGVSGGASTYPAKAIFTRSDCIIIDGIDFLCENANDALQVKACNWRLMDLMEGTSCALWGITGSNKAKVGEGYANSRDRSIGSSAWSRLTGTHINILLDEDAVVNSRIVHITPRWGEKIKLDMDFDNNGRLVKAAASSEDDSLTKFYKYLPPTFTTNDAYIVGVKFKISEATVKRYLNLLIDDGRIMKIERGRYRKTLVLVQQA